MLTIQFRAKIVTIYYTDDTIAYRRIKIPSIARHHCDMNAFRRSRKFGAYANSDLFLAMVTRALKENGIANFLRMGALPEGVAVDESGFLAGVTITLPDR
jgi:hypothetical protein